MSAFGFRGVLNNALKDGAGGRGFESLEGEDGGSGTGWCRKCGWECGSRRPGTLAFVGEPKTLYDPTSHVSVSVIDRSIKQREVLTLLCGAVLI